MKKIYGHRGVPSLAPENTIASYETAAKIPGLKWIEIDVAITEDEQLIIIHDDYLDRTTSISGEISDTSYEIIKNASAGYWFDKKLVKKKC